MNNSTERSGGIVVPKVTWKGIGIFLLVLFALAQAAFILRYEVLSLRSVQILAHQTSPESPYVCFVAVQGETKVLGMDCIDLTLTDLDRLTELNVPGQ